MLSAAAADDHGAERAAPLVAGALRLRGAFEHASTAAAGGGGDGDAPVRRIKVAAALASLFGAVGASYNAEVATPGYAELLEVPPPPTSS